MVKCFRNYNGLRDHHDKRTRGDFQGKGAWERRIHENGYTLRKEGPVEPIKEKTVARVILKRY